MNKAICVSILAVTQSLALGAGVFGANLIRDNSRPAIGAVSAKAPNQQGAPDAVLNLSKEQWRQDLNFFARELPKRHANAFHYTSRERFETEIAELDRRLDNLDGDAIYVGLDRIASLIGDGHTYIQVPADDARLPIRIRKFGDEYRVVAVPRGGAAAVGARVLKINDTPVARARELLWALTPVDETAGYREGRVEDYLGIGMLLHGLGITADRNSGRFTLAGDSGKEFVVELHAMSPSDLSKIEWVGPFKGQPLYRQKPAESFWYIYLSDSRTMYCSFRGYGNLSKNAEGLLQRVEQDHPDKLVIDMRLNGGGDYTQGLKHLIDPIRRLPSINRKGHLFVLIGVNTFSAAMNNAAQFRSMTAAILAGETIGEKPNSYQEPRNVKLPNSGLVLRYSTRYYKFVESGENLVRPDQEITPSWVDYKSGRDPVLDWALRYVPQ